MCVLKSCIFVAIQQHYLILPNTQPILNVTVRLWLIEEPLNKNVFVRKIGF